MSRHYQRGTPYERLVAKVMVDERGCWIFGGYVDPSTGYSRIQWYEAQAVAA